MLEKFLFFVVFLLIYTSIATALIMVIWNKILVDKIKGLDLQQINFWDALAIGVFVSLLTGINYGRNQMNINVSN